MKCAVEVDSCGTRHDLVTKFGDNVLIHIHSLWS
jgi:hypothetical protein